MSGPPQYNPPGGNGAPPPPPPPGGQYPQPGYGAQVPAGKPDNYLVWAILTTILCCLPFGIVAIVKAAKVDGLWNSGQYAAAQAAANDAKKWSIIAAVVGVVVGVAYAIFYIVVLAAAGSSTGY